MLQYVARTHGLPATGPDQYGINLHIRARKPQAILNLSGFVLKKACIWGKTSFCVTSH